MAHAGTWGATLARFLYGLPVAVLCVTLLHALPATRASVPAFHIGYFGWLMVGAMGQLAATAAMLVAMKQRNFVIGVAYSRTDALQVALLASLFLHELPGWIAITAIALATTGVIMLSLPHKGRDSSARGWGGTAAMYGLASGAGFALSAVGYRGAALALPDVAPWLIGAWGVLWAQAAQSLILGCWLAMRSPQALRAVAREWRVSSVAGAAGAVASLGWFTAFALTSAANVRTLGLVEVLFSYLVSRRMNESLAPAEHAGLALVVVGLVVLCAG